MYLESTLLYTVQPYGVAKNVVWTTLAATEPMPSVPKVRRVHLTQNS